MAWCACDSFDLYNGTGPNTGIQAKWNATNVNSLSMISPGRYGGQAIRRASAGALGGNAVFMTRPFTASRTAGSVGFSIRINSYPSAAWMFAAVSQGSNGQFGVTFSSSGAIIVQRGASSGAGTTLGTSTYTYPTGTWVYTELVWTCSTTVGAVNVLAEGSSILNLTGVNTQAQSTAACDGFSIWSMYASGGDGGNYDFDDYNEGDAATAIGPWRVEAIRPNANSSVQMTPLTGTNYSQVNETLCDGDTTYVAANASGLKDLYTFVALSATPAAIAGVNALSFADKTDSAAHTLANSVTSGATVSDGPAFTLTGGYGKFERPMPTDPNTGAAWTAAGVSALLAGPKLVS